MFVNAICSHNWYCFLNAPKRRGVPEIMNAEWKIILFIRVVILMGYTWLGMGRRRGVAGSSAPSVCATSRSQAAGPSMSASPDAQSPTNQHFKTKNTFSASLKFIIFKATCFYHNITSYNLTWVMLKMIVYD